LSRQDSHEKLENVEYHSDHSDQQPKFNAKHSSQLSNKKKERKKI